MDITQSDFVVYGIVQLDNKVPGELLYVGRTGDYEERVRHHNHATKSKKWSYKNNPALYNYLAEHDHYFRELEWCEDKQHAIQREKCYIHNYKPRFNTFHNGFFPFKGETHTEETKRIMSKKKKGKKTGKENVRWNHSTDTKELVKMRESGLSYRAIAAKTEMSFPGVYNRIKKILQATGGIMSKDALVYWLEKIHFETAVVLEQIGTENENPSAHAFVETCLRPAFHALCPQEPEYSEPDEESYEEFQERIQSQCL